ncbi:hypothetical protein KHA80_12685 [Anaerobacillus sp. HL2]|nr:hypothetical protein KHA80_12685 [Anaerobacillus sp. HL2]
MEEIAGFAQTYLQFTGSRRDQTLVVNAQHIKNVPGRKSDVRDAQWITRKRRPPWIS